MQVIRCNACGWIGRDDELGLRYGADEEYCPACKDTEHLTAGRELSEKDGLKIPIREVTKSRF